MRESTTKVLAYLSEAFPAFKPTETTALVWEDALHEFGSAEVMAGARALATDGTARVMPSVAELVQAIRGREMRVPIHHRDVWGSVPLDHNGCPKTVGYSTVRVPPGAAPPDHLLSWGDDENDDLLGDCELLTSRRTEQIEGREDLTALPEVTDGP